MKLQRCLAFSRKYENLWEKSQNQRDRGAIWKHVKHSCQRLNRVNIMTNICWDLGLERWKRIVILIDLVKRFPKNSGRSFIPSNTWLRTSASIQPRTRLSEFVYFSSYEIQFSPPLTAPARERASFLWKTQLFLPRRKLGGEGERVIDQMGSSGILSI